MQNSISEEDLEIINSLQEYMFEQKQEQVQAIKEITRDPNYIPNLNEIRDSAERRLQMYNLE